MPPFTTYTPQWRHFSLPSVPLVISCQFAPHSSWSWVYFLEGVFVSSLLFTWFINSVRDSSVSLLSASSNLRLRSFRYIISVFNYFRDVVGVFVGGI